MVGPKVGLFSSLRCRVSELLAKHPAARIKNGVVGRIGRKIPMAARPIKLNPRALYIYPFYVDDQKRGSLCPNLNLFLQDVSRLEIGS